MGKIYKQNCKECGEYYEGSGKMFCSVSCSSNNKDWQKKQSESHKGQEAWNKGKKGWQPNDALKEWRENGGEPWNKGVKGCISPNKTSFKKNDPRITGENNPNWKGGVSNKRRKLRKRKDYIEWRNAVYERDGWHCRGCDIKCQKGNIIAHHIKSFADHPELRTEVDNGVTLCRSCHALEHNPFNKFVKTPVGTYGQAGLNFS